MFIGWCSKGRKFLSSVIRQRSLPTLATHTPQVPTLHTRLGRVIGHGIKHGS